MSDNPQDVIADKWPKTLWICDRCKRKAFSSIEIRPGHGWRGQRCGGTVVPVEVVPVPDEAWEWVRMAPEIVAKLEAEGSEPVHVLGIRRHDDGTLDLEFRAHECGSVGRRGAT